MHKDDPHGSRGSTEHHALNYRREVKAFSSADILSSLQSARQGARDGVYLPAGTSSQSVARESPTVASRGEAAPAVAPEGHHALDYKKEVRAFSSADILKAFSNAKQGKRDEGIVSSHAARTTAGNSESGTDGASPATSRESAAEPHRGSVHADVAPRIAPQGGGDSASAGVRIRSWTDEPTAAGHTWSVDRLKDALAVTEGDSAPPPTRRGALDTASPGRLHLPEPSLLDSPVTGQTSVLFFTL